MALIMKEVIINPPSPIQIERVNIDQFKQLGYSSVDLKLLQSRLTTSQINTIIKSEIDRKILFSYLKFESFNFEEINAYEKIRTENQVSFKAAINLNHHPYMMSHFYLKQQDSINKDDTLILVNKNYKLNRDYVPNHLVFTVGLKLLVDDKTRYYLQEEAYIALRALFNEAQKQDLNLYLSNGYRSYEKQEKIYTQYQIDIGNADLFSARPGHSEHQSGLAVDLTCKSANYQLVEKFAYTEEGFFIKHHAHRYGFIERYPKDKESITGYLYEPWHLRYVGIKAATIIYQKNLALEEYLIHYTVIKK